MAIKIRQRTVIACTRMLKNKNSARLNYTPIEHFGCHLFKAWQIVGRIGENEIKRSRPAAIEKAKHISPHQTQIISTQTSTHLFDKPILCRSLLHRSNHAGATAEQFESHRPRSSKQIQSYRILQINQFFNDIKYIFPRKIRSGPGRNICRHIESAASVFSSNYPHCPVINKSKGALIIFLLTR